MYHLRHTFTVFLVKTLETVIKGDEPERKEKTREEERIYLSELRVTDLWRNP